MSSAARRRPMASLQVPTMTAAMTNASKLTEAEIRGRIIPAHRAVDAFRQGRGTYEQWLILATCVNLGRAIESGGIVRGLLRELEQANATVQAIADRMEQKETAGWRPGALHWQELEALRTLVRVHSFQLHQVSYGEYTEAYRLATARVQSSGGEVVDLTQHPASAIVEATH